MPCKISKIEYYLPEKVLTNKDFESEFPEWNSEKIEQKIGIKQRHISADNETALDMAVKAGEKLLENIDKDSIDFLLLCTQSPDYYLPTSACILQEKLKLKTGIGALDFNMGCSGFVYGLAVAKGLINAGICSNVMLVTSETYTKHLHPKDKVNRTIFGDAAAAAIISKSDTEQIFEFEIGTDGTGMNNLIVLNGGLRARYNPEAQDTIDEAGNVRNPNFLFMNGPEIFNFTIERIPGVVENCLKKNNITIEGIDYIVFHQANKYMLNYLRKKMKIPEEKFYLDMEDVGNTVSSTIPIALKNCFDKQILTPGKKVLLVGFGVGYSWGATIINI